MSDDHGPARRFAAGVGLVQMAFGVSLFVDPYRWAGVFRWRPEPQTDVGLYFGRCLGALAIGAGLEACAQPATPRAADRGFDSRRRGLGCWPPRISVRGSSAGSL
jgi:hypothetical protein